MKKYAGGSQGGDYQQYMKKYAGGNSGSYQQYMKQYSGGSQGGSQSQSGDYQQYMKKYASQGGEAKGDQNVNLLAMGGLGGASAGTGPDHQSQGHDYEKFIHKYAGGQGSHNSYQQYMNKYAGKYTNNTNYQQYMKKYAGEYQKYTDYQTFIQRYSRGNQDKDVVQEARDANTTTQLNAWRNSEEQNVQWYVPGDYTTYANKHIQKQYNQRLAELHHHQGDSSSPFLATLDLYEQPQDKEHMNAMQLRQASEAGITKAEHLSDSLKHAAADTQAIEKMAARPADNVASAFTDRSKAMENKVEQLQQQAKSKQFSADFASQVRQTVAEVKALRDDEFQALRQARRESNAATRHAAHGAQTQVRDEAQKVRALSDRMARKNQSDQDLANELQNRVEVAADNAENNGEELARRTQDRLQDHMSKAQQEYRNEADRRVMALHEVEGQFKELNAAGSNTFLARYSDVTMSSLPPLVTPLALVSGGFFTAWLCLTLFAKYSSRRIEMPQSTLG
jgi:hypothetical protein